MNKPLRKNALAEDFTWALQIAAGYTVQTDLTYYKTADGIELKLDLYLPNGDRRVRRPALVFFHAGAWMEGCTRESWALWFLPFLQLGWVTINVGYRLSNVALAPAAVEDGLRAWQWITRNAAEYCIDQERIVLGGLSAGGHLALTTGMISQFMAGGHEPSGAERHLFSADLVDVSHELLAPRAIINWCGITDVADVAHGANRQDFATKWIGDRPNAGSIARAVSPLTYVRPGVAPVITVHGDKDAIVPYSHATRLHRALAAAGVSNELVTIRGGGHAFELDAHLRSYPRIMDFLQRCGLPISRR